MYKVLTYDGILISALFAGLFGKKRINVILNMFYVLKMF
jgi:hypothetical protein